MTTLSKLLEQFEVPKVVYIVGTGPSLRVFPMDFLSDKFIIGLNQAWKSLPFCPTINLTIHPNECIPQNNLDNIWLTKKKGWLAKAPSQVKNYIYYFENNKCIHDYSPLTGDKQDMLYVGRGIHTAACHLAGLLGSRIAVLIGCDFSSIGDQHHVTAQSVRFHGLPPQGVYREYYINLKKLRPILKEKYGLDIISMNPYIGLGYHDEDHDTLLELNGLPKLEKPIDDSSYVRDSFDFI